MYIMKHMVPLYVYVDDNDRVTKVVVDDDTLSEPVGIVRGTDFERGWLNEDVQTPTGADKAKYAEDSEGSDAWPAWEIGW